MTENLTTELQSPTPWMPPHDACWSLADDEVHLWRVMLDVSPAQLAALTAVLGDDEPERASRRIFERDRNHFIAARGILRRLLGRYLRREPRGLSFAYGPYGKPSLRVVQAEHSALEFNVAHSHGLALIAVSRARVVGVDLEYMRDDKDCDALARRCCSPAELRYYETLSDDVRGRFFFAAWARKESLLKATGRGLSLAMRDVEVAAAARIAAGKLDLADTSGALKSWRWQAINPDADYAGAVAAEDGPWRLCCWQWPNCADG